MSELRSQIFFRPCHLTLPGEFYKIHNQPFSRRIINKNALKGAPLKLGLCFFLSLASTLFSQQFITLTVEDGLSSNHVYSIFQDHLGFMWFCTNRGLDRYDGVTIRTFRHDPADANSLSSSDVKRIYEDKDHILWIGASNGLNRFDPKTETFTRYCFEENQNKAVRVGRIVAEGDSILWIATQNGLVRFRKNQGDYIKFFWRDEHGEKLSERTFICSLTKLDDGSFVLGSIRNDFFRFDPKTYEFSELHDSLAARNWGSGFCSFRDSEGLVWLGLSWTAVLCLNEKTGEFRSYKDTPTQKYVNYPCTAGIIQDIDGNIWFATLGGGLTRYNKNTETFSYFTPKPGVEGAISTALAIGLCVDKQGNLWCGSYDGGVNMLPRWSKNIRLHRQKQEMQKSIGYGVVNDLCQDPDGSLWVVSSGGGISKISSSFDEATHMSFSGQKPFTFNWYQAVERDSKNNLWFCGEVVFFMDWRTKIAEYVPGYPGQNPGKIWPRATMMCMSEDSLGAMWFGSTYEGLIRYDKNKVTAYQHDPDDSTSISGNSVYSLMCDSDGNVWAGTGAGLSCLPKNGNSFINYEFCSSFDKSKKIPGVYTTFEDSRGRLWIGTPVGLYALDMAKNCFVDRTVDLGIKPQPIKAILEDKNGDLWLRSETQLYRYNIEKKHVDQFGPDDGFVGINTSQWRFRDFCTGQTGHIYYGGSRIVGRFHPDSLFSNPAPPPVVLTELEVNYKPVLPGENSVLKSALPFADALYLQHDQNTFSLKFAALDYTKPQRNQYAYRLEGLHNEWVHVQAGRPAVFTNLSPRKYTFHVKASNNDGAWNEQGATLDIRILPPWWRTGWAYVGYFMLFFGAVISIYSFQLNRARLRRQFEMEQEQSQKLQDIDRMKSRFFANISHEFRTPLTLILGPLENFYLKTKSTKNKQQFGLMLRSGRRLLQLINQLLDFSRLEAGSLKLQASETDIVFFIKRIVSSFMSLAERHNITLHFQSNLQVLLCFIDHDKFEKIMANLLSNAFKFTPHGGRISVSVEKRDSGKNHKEQWVKIAVRDSGPGIAAEHLNSIFDRFYQIDNGQTRKHEGAGIGLALVKEFVQLHHGDIFVKSDPGAGSCFYIRLLLGRTHLADDEIVAQAVSETIFEPQKSMDDAGQEASVAIRTDHKKSRLLIVEDNEDVRFYIRDFLADRYQIKEAPDGMAGLAVARTWLPEIIISDVMMPGMDGFELCKKLKTDELTSHIPVILLTARASESSKLDGLEIGADDYIIKPFNAKELKMRVKNLIESRRILRQKFSNEIIVQPAEITVTSLDETFLKRAIQLVDDNMADDQLGVEFLAQRLGTSRVHLNRKIRALTDLTAQQFIRTLRLKRAAMLLQKQAGTVSEIAFQVGFSNPSHFAECFKELFGMRPSVYKKHDDSK